MSEIIEVNVTEYIISILESDKDSDYKREEILEFHGYEIAKALEVMSKEQRDLLYAVLPNKNLSEVFAELDPEDAFWILESTSLSVIIRVFSEMEVDDLADILGYCEDDEDRITYLSLINVKKRVVVRTILDYDDSLVGSIMNNIFIEVHKNDTVKEAIQKVVHEAPDNEFINNIYVTDGIKLVGAMSLKELISAGNMREQIIEDIMS